MWSGIGTYSVWNMRRSNLALPPLQRGQVWTPEQQVAFCESYWLGRIMHSHILLWRRSYRSDEHLIVDGQQRLSALGLPVRRPDGSLNACSAFLDLHDGRWYTERTEDRFTAAELADWTVLRCVWERSRVLGAWMCHAEKRMSVSRIAVSVIEPNIPQSTVQAWFRTMAIPGVALTPEEAERLCVAAEGEP
jgi:hypothetical protein